jgi:hypothetical protein
MSHFLEHAIPILVLEAEAIDARYERRGEGSAMQQHMVTQLEAATEQAAGEGWLMVVVSAGRGQGLQERRRGVVYEGGG